ncbi:tail fiber domain-containing protein [bacterium]|nr:tail fiber domain-containing protein [bacterium]
MKNNKKAFSVAEMMTVLLILSIVLAASMPIITKRTKSSVDKTWQAATNGSDAYFGVGTKQGIAVGATGFPGGSYGKLLLNVNDSNPADLDVVSHILFSTTNDGIVGKLRFLKNRIELGHNANASADKATALGQTTEAGANSTAVGFESKATGEGATALGTNSKAESNNATAIGFGAQSAENATGLGTGAKASETGSIAIGYNVVASEDNSIAIGSADTTVGQNAVAIGASAKAEAKNATAIGYNSTAAGEGSVALGYGTDSSGNHSTAIGYGSGVSNAFSYAIAIGSEATANNQLNLGTRNGTDGISQINIGTASSIINIHGAAYQASDLRKKNILGEYKSGLNEITKIKTYEFTYKSDEAKNKRVGVIAQELQKVFPSAVKTDDDGFLSIRKEELFYAMINAIKELSINYNDLKKENAQLKLQLEELSKRVEKLEQK